MVVMNARQQRLNGYRPLPSGSINGDNSCAGLRRR
ncbi:hypothetical protein L243_40335 [Salmonella enterica subsp. enterica serovar Worthington str. BCH-3008]|nr:hypothetical protein L243_40335 [Salmonella enterica subsp. enterica serovar Worthington str. BCH-3008]